MKKWLSEREAAIELGISPAHLGKWRTEKILNGEKFPFHPQPKPATNNRLIYMATEIANYRKDNKNAY
jgi:hypothetical protein